MSQPVPEQPGGASHHEPERVVAPEPALPASYPPAFTATPPPPGVAPQPGAASNPYGVPGPYAAPGQPAGAPSYPLPGQYAVPVQYAPSGQYAAPAQYAPSPQHAPGQYVPPGAYPYSAPYPAARPSTGTLSWALGFLIFIPIPFLSAIVSGIAMAASYGASARRGGIARENGRWAANWGLTYLTVSTVLLIAHIVALIGLSGRPGMSDFFPIGIPITLYLLVSILHIVLVITGTVRASSGKLMSVPFAIRYLRG